jgi:multiple sugar transport system substrate-binding protein
MIIKKILCFAIAMLMAVSILSWKNVAIAADGDKIEILMWVYSDWTSGRQGELFNKWAGEFVASHPEIGKITMIGKNDNELLTGLMSGVGLPDCFSASFRDGKKYREAIDLLDLQPMFDAAESSYRDGFIKDAIEVVQADGGTWALPFMSYIPIIFRNLDVLEKAGIDPSKGTPTFDVFLDQLQKIKDVGIDGSHSWALDWYTAGAILAGEESLTIGEKDGKTTIQPEQLAPTFEMLLKLKPLTNNLNRDDQVAIEAFKTNKLGFIIEGPWNIEGYEASGVRFDIIPVPSLHEGQRNGGLRGWDAIYGHDSGDAKKNELVAAWLKYLTDYERQKEFTSYVGRPVLRNDVMDDPSVQQLEVCRVSAKAQLGGINQMDFFRSNVFWTSTIADVAVQVNDGTLTPQQAADEMIEAINGLLAEEGE